MLLQLIVIAIGATASFAQQPVSTDQSVCQTVGTEAYLYYYALISMDVTRRQSLCNVAPNTFANLQQFPDPTKITIVRPNFDTLYSTAWLDLSQGPIVLTVPDTNGRYYLMPMLDMWTDVFAVPGWRTSGTTAGNFAIIPPGWSGSLPAGVTPIYAPTPTVWVIGRTQTNGAADYSAVNALQAQYQLTTLANYPNPSSFQINCDPNISRTQKPLNIVNGLSISDYLTYAANLSMVNPPHATDWSQVDIFSQIGLVYGQPFDWNSLSSSCQAGLTAAKTAALQAMQALASVVASGTNGWQISLSNVGVYGNAYLSRGYTAMVGLGANQPEDAVYPMLVFDSNGNRPVGSNCYTLTFAAGQTPPAQAFWSVTMYDGNGFPVLNSINRYALHNWDPLVYNSDGSLTLYIQANQPASASAQSNWLPGPSSGYLGVTMRIYAPQNNVLQSKWLPPPAVAGTCA